MPSAPRTITREQARRVAVRAQLLTADRPTDLVEVVRHLTLLQIDPTASVAPSADLVAWSRLGDSYEPEDLARAVEQDRDLVELVAQPSPREPAVAMLRAAADLPMHACTWSTFGYQQTKDWYEANAGFRTRLLDQLRADGPLPSSQLTDTADVPWTSSGWTHQRTLTQMLEVMLAHGAVAVSHRRGRERWWDLPERVYPVDLVPLGLEEGLRLRAQRWLGALGIARAKAAGEAGVPVAVEGVRGVWRLDPEVSLEPLDGRTALLSPFDRLVHDRKRAVELFDFEFGIELYKPAAKRRWGYYALPVLHGDRLVGKVDATADRDAGVLRVDAVHEDVPFDAAIRDGVDAELDALATWLGLDGVQRP
jgi:uncharacterized protein